MISWGVYAVPAWAPVGTYEEWYWNHLMVPNSPTQKFHNATYGPDFKYHDFVKVWEGPGGKAGELFNATALAQLFKSGGFKYFAPLSKHHDGYCMFTTDTSWNWNSVDTGPHRDVIGELTTALRAEGLHAGMYFSLFEWFNPILNGPNAHDYVTQVMLPQMHELVTQYEPDILWTDGEWTHDAAFWNSTDFIAWLYNDSPVKEQVVINDRWGKHTRGKHGGFYTEEYSSQTVAGHKWEENSGIDIHSYGFNRNTPASDYLTVGELVHLLVRSVAFGGNLCLNVAMAYDGRVPAIMAERIEGLGAWVDTNGAGIYSSRRWRVPQDNATATSDMVYYTRAKPTAATTVFAFVDTFPAPGGQWVLTSPVPSATTSVSLLGYPSPLSFDGAAGVPGMRVHVPADVAPSAALSQMGMWTLQLEAVA